MGQVQRTFRIAGNWRGTPFLTGLKKIILHKEIIFAYFIA
jgi:hypothetical protein